MKKIVLLLLFVPVIAFNQENKFSQLGYQLPTPNIYRAADGQPGPEYWQQKADYKMNINLNDQLQRIDGDITITYHNLSPHTLQYLWLQLDQNVRSLTSESHLIREQKLPERFPSRSVANFQPWFDGGFKIQEIHHDRGPLDYTIVKTMMRVDLPQPLKPGKKFTFKIKYWYNINEHGKIGGRSGFEYFEEDDNYLYAIAQFYPRMCMYTDREGWQNKQFLGRGEFALPFGDYEVKITVPADHLVAATGTLQNQDEVLDKKMINRLKNAKENFEQPTIIYTQEEAVENEKEKSPEFKTWHFSAENVRDFAFASSRKFIWDAMPVKMNEDRTVMAMSMYPKEGNPLWEKYSTKAVAHTLKWYSHYTFDYPYPVAWSINADRLGMEYPMICFNFGRTEEDGTYSERLKYGMISVIIHEVGHNYFPMIVNSDERQWTWMDEGLNTYLQYLTEQQWERNYPSRRGPAFKIVDYMKGDKSKISPIMTNSESIFQFGNNAYGKPATALNILRETIIGRELFDSAFKIYANRWKFKHPGPAEFFRTIEDATAIDLDWFWRGWFFGKDHVDIALTDVKSKSLQQIDPESLPGTVQSPQHNYISTLRNRTMIISTYDEIDTTLIDFYSNYNPESELISDSTFIKDFYEQLTHQQRVNLKENPHFYELTFENVGGLPMPIILKMVFEDGTSKILQIPAEIWRFDNTKVTKVFPASKPVDYFELDPHYETADVDRNNNYFPRQQILSGFDLYEKDLDRNKNPMQRAQNN